MYLDHQRGLLRWPTALAEDLTALATGTYFRYVARDKDDDGTHSTDPLLSPALYDRATPLKSLLNTKGMILQQRLNSHA